MSAPLLVVAHEATRTGSPRVLLELLRHASGRLDVPVAVRLLAEGPLADDLRAVADVDHVGRRPAAVLLNSALAATAVADIDDGVPVLAYVHEGPEALASLPQGARDALARRCDRVLCVSDGARQDLLALGVPAERIGVLPPVVVPPPRPDPAAVAEARAELGGGAALVVGCGEAGWRKGADLFVAIAQRVAAASPEARFAWVGRRPRRFGRILDHDVAQIGLSERVRFIGQVADAAPMLAAADVLLMPSREDPQPLVALEAGLLGTPTAGFAVGGLADLAGSGAAVATPFPDTSALAAATAGLLHDPEARERVAAAARDWAAGHHSVEVVGPAFVAEMDRLLALRRHPT